MIVALPSKSSFVMKKQDSGIIEASHKRIRPKLFV